MTNQINNIIQFNHEDFGGMPIYFNVKPVILVSDVSTILNEERDKGIHRWVIHISIHPNQSSAIYNQTWRGLNHLTPEEYLQLESTRWSYIYEHTGYKYYKHNQ